MCTEKLCADDGVRRDDLKAECGRALSRRDSGLPSQLCHELKAAFLFQIVWRTRLSMGSDSGDAG